MMIEYFSLIHQMEPYLVLMFVVVKVLFCCFAAMSVIMSSLWTQGKIAPAFIDVNGDTNK